MPLEPVEAECASDGGTVEIEVDGSPISDSNPLPVDVVAGSISIDPGDIEIGAVEIKSATNDNRAEVDLPANLSGADLVLGVHDPLAATATAQTTGNNSLAAIDAGTPAALGQTTMAASQPVTIASDQAAVPVSSATLATAANQTTANASLASIDSGTPAALGSATSANSMPVVIASDQVAVPVVGNVASAATDSGNPVKAGAKFNTIKPTFTDGQRGDLQIGARGELIIGGAAASTATIIGNPVPIALVDASGAIASFRGYPTNADGGLVLSSNTAAVSVANQYGFNGTGWDRNRANTSVAVIPAGTTTTQTAIALTTFNATKLVLVVNISAGAGSLVVAINGVTVSSYSYPLLSSSSLSGVAVTPLRVFPGSTPSANAVANDVLPRNLTITATVTGSVTYGIDAILGV